MVPSLTLRFRMPALLGQQRRERKTQRLSSTKPYSIGHPPFHLDAAKIKQHNSWRTAGFWVAHASRVLVSASRRNDLPRKVRESGTLSPTRETRALPNRELLCSQRFYWIDQRGAISREKTCQ